MLEPPRQDEGDLPEFEANGHDVVKCNDAEPTGAPWTPGACGPESNAAVPAVVDLRASPAPSELPGPGRR